MKLTEENLLLYRSILSTAVWQDECSNILPNISGWLFEKGSLTKKLQGICKKIEVDIITQHWINEKKEQKSTTLFQNAWLREVILKGNEEHWIFAQTKFSQSIMDKRKIDIISLGRTPIGLWLFSQKTKRIKLQWYQDPQTLLYARYSLLSLDDEYIEIKELFLNKFNFI